MDSLSLISMDTNRFSAADASLWRHLEREGESLMKRCTSQRGQWGRNYTARRGEMRENVRSETSTSKHLVSITIKCPFRPNKEVNLFSPEILLHPKQPSPRWVVMRHPTPAAHRRPGQLLSGQRSKCGEKSRHARTNPAGNTLKTESDETSLWRLQASVSNSYLFWERTLLELFFIFI